MRKTRRQFLCDCGLMGITVAGASMLSGVVMGAESQRRKTLTMYGPPAGLSVTLAHASETNALTGLVDHLKFSTYRDPDMLRANFISGRWALACMPSYAAANLYNKGLKVHLMNIMTQGLLYMVSSDSRVNAIEDLKGEEVVMPYKGDLPDLVFQTIAKKKGMKINKDFRMRYVGTPFEGLQLLLSGRAKHALLPEPAATAGLMMGIKSGKKIKRVINLQEAWGEATNGPARIPQSGMIISEALLEEMPTLPVQLNQSLQRSTDWVVNHPVNAGRLAAAYMPLKAPVIAQSIPYSHFSLDSAKAIQSELERFFSILLTISPEIMGGKLPEDDFYLG